MRRASQSPAPTISLGEEKGPPIDERTEGLQPAHLPRHADQRPAGRYLVIPRWVVGGYETRVAGDPKLTLRSRHGSAQKTNRFASAEAASVLAV